MFSPAETRSSKPREGRGGRRVTPFKSREGRVAASSEDAASASPLLPGSPSTPLHHQRVLSPSTSSPSMLWSHQRAGAIRSPPFVSSLDKKDEMNNNHPVFVADFPQELRALQAEEVPHSRTDCSGLFGGMDQNTGLSWMLQHRHMFVWSHVCSQSPESFRSLQMPQTICTMTGESIDPRHGDAWAVCVIGLENTSRVANTKFTKMCRAAGLVMCSRKSSAVIYWPNVFSEAADVPVVSLSPDESALGEKPGASPIRKVTANRVGTAVLGQVNSMVACAYVGPDIFGCVAVACRANGELWRFDCSPSNVSRHRMARNLDSGSAHDEISQSLFIKNSPGVRTVVWLNDEGSVRKGWRQLLLLTATGLECWDVELIPDGQMHLAWSFDVLADLDSGKLLAGHKQVWLLDVQVDNPKRRLKLLLASFSKDRINSSSYMQYFLATYSCHSNGAQREGGIHIILPKARIEEEEFLYSMRLRIGGKPEGSAMILARDGTATVAHCNAGNITLYQFDLAWDAGKVLDACVLSCSEDNDEGSWLVLTEKAGVWAIPGKAVLLCGVEPPERSLSRRGSQNEQTSRDDRRRSILGSNLRVESEKTGVLERMESSQLQAQTQPLHDEEAEALVSQFFQEFLMTGQTDGVLEKLQQAGALEKEGSMNVFVLASRGIVDTLAKQWTMGSTTNTAMMVAVSSQLVEKQRRHQQFLQFLSASKCHEELLQRQRSTLHLILEHGEKLAAMIWLREMHNNLVQARLQSPPSSAKSADMTSGEMGGALWDLVQLVGEKARRDNVMLLDREKAEVFYSRVSDLEDLFGTVHSHIEMVVGRDRDQPAYIQIEKICEISHACTNALQTAIRYKDIQHSWYPSPEGMTPWYCKPVVRSGLWRLAMLVLELKEEGSILVPSKISTLMEHLERLSDILLESYAGAITAKVECEEEYRGLQMDYWNRRDTLLGALYRYAKESAEAAAEGLDAMEKEPKILSIIQKLYPPLVALARRHAGYQTLWDICADLNDTDCLRSLMHESMGLKEGRFSNFVFEQCYKNRYYAKLLRLGEEFKEELSLFLQKHKDLLWLHELHMQHFTLASSTLHWLALSTDKALSASIIVSQGNSKPVCKFGMLELRYRKRLLNLAKISILAGGDIKSVEKATSIDADIGMLKIQGEAHQLGLVEDDDILTPRQLVEVCLKSESRDLVLRTFDVFAWGGDLFRRSNRSLLETAWLRAADQDNWVTMRQVAERDGWSDEQHIVALQSTALYDASKRCYGEYSVCFGGSFHTVLPLLQEEAGDKFANLGGAEMSASVETVLMQHQDFADAGQAMLTAIRMGKGSIEVYDQDVREGMEVQFVD